METEVCDSQKKMEKCIKELSEMKEEGKQKPIH